MSELEIVKKELNEALMKLHKLESCYEQDLIKLRWWEDMFQSFTRAEVIEMKERHE